MPDTKYPGFEKFSIHPRIPSELDFAEGELHTVKGIIKSVWKKSGGILTMDVTIPANTTAIVSIPVKKGKVTENGRDVSKLKSMKLIRKERGLQVYEVGSGSYSFKSAY